MAEEERVSASALALADAALERGEVPTVPHAGSPCEAIAWLVRGQSSQPLLIDFRDDEFLASVGAVVEIRWYDPRLKRFFTRYRVTDTAPARTPTPSR